MKKKMRNKNKKNKKKNKKKKKFIKKSFTKKKVSKKKTRDKKPTPHLITTTTTTTTTTTPPSAPMEKCCCKREDWECVGKEIDGNHVKYSEECCPEECCCIKKEGECVGNKKKECCKRKITKGAKWSSLFVGPCNMGEASSCNQDKEGSQRGNNMDEIKY